MRNQRTISILMRIRMISKILYLFNIADFTYSEISESEYSSDEVVIRAPTLNLIKFGSL